MINLKNRRGADKILAVYWFVILFLAAGGIFMMVYTFDNYSYDVRGAEANNMIDSVASCIAPNGKISSDIISGSTINPSAIDSNTCTTPAECQRVIGFKIVSIANSLKDNLGIQGIDDSVKSQGIAQNFDCLILQIAMQESSVQQCQNIKDSNNNPLYCDGNIDQTRSLSTTRESSLGAMQVNVLAHPDAHPENFQSGVIYAIKNVLIPGYNQYKNGKVFTPTNIQYSGWRAAIRAYNGWGSGGDNSYVENVIGKQPIINQMFLEVCSTNPPQTSTTDLQKKCNLNFQSGTSNNEYYVEVNVYDLVSGIRISTTASGNSNLKADCQIQNPNYQTLSKCAEKKFYTADSNNNQYSVDILSVIRKTSKNVQ